MESQHAENRVMHELAYVYIALAHGTDDQLSDEEIDQIAERLRGWELDTAQTVTSALKQAMDEYMADAGVDRLDRAVAAIRDAFPAERRKDLLEDLMGIAIADGRFLFTESSFIERVGRTLEVRLEGADGVIGRSWSVLGGTSTDGNDQWTPVHDLALIYVTLAHRTDDDLSDDEISAIATKLNEWIPEAPEDEVLRVVQDALTVYVQGPDKRMFTEAVESVRDRVPRHQLSALLSDLSYVASADGRMLEEEKQIIAQLAQAWSVQVDEASAARA